MNLLSEAFYQLPFQFDPAPILEELSQISESEWQDNPQGFIGIESLILVSSQGKDTHVTYGEMKATPRLNNLPKIRDLISIFDTPLGATRIMRLAPKAKVESHVDLHYYWKHRFRIHLILQTHPDAIFGCREQVHHLPAGQIWISDSWSSHFVENNSNIDRIHIVIDTIGSEKIWQWLKQAWNSSSSNPPLTDLPLKELSSPQGNTLPLRFEKHGDSIIKHPGQVSEITQDILADYPNPSELKLLLHRLDRGWKELWSEWGQMSIFPYQKFLQEFISKLEALSPKKLISNQVSVPQLLEIQLGIPSNLPLEIKRPIFILGAPRSAQTELQRLLSKHTSIWRLPRSLDLFEHISALHPKQQDYQNNSLSEAAISPKEEMAIFQFLKKELRNSRYPSFSQNPTPLKGISFIDASPKNAFRMEAILKLFPNARFIYIHQNPIQNLHSLMDAWRSGNFVPYLDLSKWHGEYPWAFTLIPDWKNLMSKPLAEICFTQYRSCHEHIIQSLQRLPPKQYLTVNIDKLNENPTPHLRQVFRFLQYPLPQNMQAMKLELPKSTHQLQNAIELQAFAAQITQFYQHSVLKFT